MKERVCLQCGKSIQGRMGKKFCSGSCKNAYNNRKASETRKFKSRILAGLSENYSILDTLEKSGTTSTDLEILCNMGFNPEIFTGGGKDRCGHSERKCFDICYCQSNVKIFNLRRTVSLERGPSVHPCKP